ncbi:MAG: serine/threonine-protein kinase [Proteobacteria bacterium]|nr:serine/threonine-protein kinase [Pseudomonadota bacterium]
MGAVYLAIHPVIGKRVAIKVLHPSLAADASTVARFFVEAKAVNEIGHPNIVDVSDLGRMTTAAGAELVYFVMECLEGESLAARLRRGRPSIELVRHVIGQCCSALAASHRTGIVHRDLKPDNIFLCARPDDPSFVKVLDFGIAKLTGDGAHHPTQTGQIIGTPAYMAPEQCGGGGEVDARSDVYSLGVVLYEMLTGALPFGGKTMMDMISGHLFAAPPPPRALVPSIPVDLEAAALRALAKRPDERFQTMAELARAIGMPMVAASPAEALLATQASISAIETDRTLAPESSAPQRATPPPAASPAPPPMAPTATDASTRPPRPKAAIALVALLGAVTIGVGVMTLRAPADPTRAVSMPVYAAPRARLELPEITIVNRVEKPEALVELAAVGISALEPSVDAPLATNAAAAGLGARHRERAVVEALVAKIPL